MKRPSFQFYPSDWLRDTALRSCSTGARGLWIDMICYMHEGNPYGHLKVGDKVILPANLARMAGETFEVVEGWLNELQQAGVYSLAEDGAIYSKRMVRDESLRESRAKGGHLGGNPALKVNLKDNHKVGNEDKQNPTPSSSSSSASSSKNTKPQRGSRLASDWVLLKSWGDWALAERPDLDPRKVAAEFKDYWVSVPGQKGCKLDWEATWRNWVRNQKAPKVAPADIARVTVPSQQGPDPALQKIITDSLSTKPPPADIRARMAELTGKRA
jgi:hypothetical protein